MRKAATGILTAAALALFAGPAATEPGAASDETLPPELLRLDAMPPPLIEEIGRRGPLKRDGGGSLSLQSKQRCSLFDACIQVLPESAKFDTSKGAIQLKVAFVGGSAEMQQRVKEAAELWTADTNAISFDFGCGGENCKCTNAGGCRRWSAGASANIRIAFERKSDQNLGGFWSIPGNVILERPSNLPTMNLEGLDMLPAEAFSDAQWNAPRGKRAVQWAVVHEFGHVLGFAHEMMHTKCQPSLIYEGPTGLYTVYGREDWSRGQVDFNFKRDVYAHAMGLHSFTEGPAADHESMMMYPTVTSVWDANAPSECRLRPSEFDARPVKLSEQDRLRVRVAYPKLTDPELTNWRIMTPPPPVTAPDAQLAPM